MPSADYTELEVNKLDADVKNGGNVMLFTGVTNVPTPNLNEWLEEYGIGVTDMRVLDNERALYSPANIVAGISDKTITGEMVVSDTTYILMPEARALEQLFTRENNRETTVFLMSSDASYAKVITPDATTQTNTFEEGDKTGPFPVGIMSNYGVTVSGVTTSGRVVVFSSLLMSADSVFDISSLANKAFFSEAINYINPITNVLSIEAREYYSEDLTILSAQGDVVFWVLLIIIPSAILLLGIGVWVKRRHK
jgi:ABC-2 type transport system permease protein